MNVKKLYISIFLLAQSITAFCTPAELYYIVKKADEHTLKIELSFIGSKTGKTVLLLPNEWAEKIELYKNINKLTVLTKTKVIIKDGIEPAQKIIIHPPYQQLTVSYKLKQRLLSSPQTPSEVFEPAIQKDFFYFIGTTGLITPDLNDNELINVHFTWNVPTDWSIANSYDVNRKQQTAKNITLTELKDSLFMAGHLQLKHLNYQNIDFWTAKIGEFSNLNTSNFFNTCAKIISFQQNFWASPHQKYRLLALVAVDTNKDSFQGTSIYQSFLLALPRNATLHTGFGLYWLAAHEIFHAWNRPDFLAIDTSHSEASIYWLTEGFTDYYALESLLRTGIYTLDEYVTAYNNILVDYYTSPVNDYTNQQIEEFFWKNYDIERLPYQRGNILAHNWNVKIKHQSHGKYSFDDFMRAIFSITPEKKQTLNQIKTLSKKYLSSGVDTDLTQYIDKGELLIPDAESLGPCAKLVFEKKRKDQTSFPVRYNFNTHLIYFVQKGSQAEKSGLKVGYKLIHWDYKKNDPNYPVTVQIDDGKQKRTIQYPPDKGKFINVPQFKLDKIRFKENPKQCTYW